METISVVIMLGLITLWLMWIGWTVHSIASKISEREQAGEAGLNPADLQAAARAPDCRVPAGSVSQSGSTSQPESVTLICGVSCKYNFNNQCGRPDGPCRNQS